jgi:hypothetical protein
MERFAGTISANQLGLEIANLPFELPTIDVKQYWHIRNDHDAGSATKAFLHRSRGFEAVA